MASLEEFAKNIRVRGRRIEEKSSESARKVAGAILQAVVVATPVKSGRARGGWIVGIDSPITAKSENLDTAGSSTITTGNSVISNQRTGQTIYISNNVEYISVLDGGSSSQAPKNFVAMAVKQGSNLVKRIKVVD